MSQRVNFYVNKYIEGDPTIKVGLQRGLITSRILTKHIIEEEREFKGSFDDIRNAVRKYTDETVPIFDFRDAYKAFKNAYIDVRSKLACIEISRNFKVEDILKTLNGLAGNEKFVRIANNAKSFLLILLEEDVDETIKLIKKEDIFSVNKEICSITVHLDASVKHIPGVYFLMMGQISFNQINIYDVASYKSEFTIYVDQKDVAKVHQLLYDLTEYQKRFCSQKG